MVRGQTAPARAEAVCCFALPGRESATAVTHDELLDALWPETYVQPQVLRTYILELRKLLGDVPDEPLFIQTVPKARLSLRLQSNDRQAGHQPSSARALRALWGAMRSSKNWMLIWIARRKAPAS